MPLGPQRPLVFDIDAPPALPADQLRDLLGGKAANLVAMATQLRLPVPPAFTVTTEACRAYFDGQWPATLDDELREHMASLGKRVGRRFGDPVDPLLVSVRSGAPVSMPGMMDTLLNLGLNHDTARGLAAASGDEKFAADCLRRFGENCRAVIGDAPIPDDPWLQLRRAVEAVFRSWNSERAIAYRRREGIADDLGTAVTVQAMVFGNRGEDSGTGVVFTRNPATGEHALYGDVMFNAQGEDVVAGTHATEPIAVLDERLPVIAEELRRHAAVLEHHLADLCDIEFTIEQGRLWLLQVRTGKRSPRAALRMAIDMAQDETFPLTRADAVQRVAAHLADPPRVFIRADGTAQSIATGLPASPGVASGAIATSTDAAERFAAEGRAVILVRAETSPEDVRGMALAAGVLTARGGLASHAAVVARGWGIPAVVGAAAVLPRDGEVEIAGRVLAAGEELTIDGSTGEVFSGVLAGSWAVAPEAATVLAWAAELGIDIPTAARTEGPAATSAVAVGGEPAWTVTADDVLRALTVKGAALPDQLPELLLAEQAEIEPLVDRLGGDGLIETAGGQLRLTASGKLAASALMSADRDGLGADSADRTLEEFHRLDGRMKDIVTRWQVREVAGEQVLNDHSDAAYDARLLADLAELHAETAEWLSPLAAAFPRFGAYRARLGRALELAHGGDQRFVASPRVDSYHGVWFELHEDLIRLAGKKRSDATTG